MKIVLTIQNFPWGKEGTKLLWILMLHSTTSPSFGTLAAPQCLLQAAAAHISPKGPREPGHSSALWGKVERI